MAGDWVAIEAGRRGVIPTGIGHEVESQACYPGEGEGPLAAGTVRSGYPQSRGALSASSLRTPTRPPDQAWPV